MRGLAAATLCLFRSRTFPTVDFGQYLQGERNRLKRFTLGDSICMNLIAGLAHNVSVLYGIKLNQPGFSCPIDQVLDGTFSVTIFD